MIMIIIIIIITKIYQTWYRKIILPKMARWNTTWFISLGIGYAEDIYLVQQ